MYTLLHALLRTLLRTLLYTLLHTLLHALLYINCTLYTLLSQLQLKKQTFTRNTRSIREKPDVERPKHEHEKVMDDQKQHQRLIIHKQLSQPIKVSPDKQAAAAAAASVKKTASFSGGRLEKNSYQEKSEVVLVRGSGSFKERRQFETEDKDNIHKVGLGWG